MAGPRRIGRAASLVVRLAALAALVGLGGLAGLTGPAAAQPAGAGTPVPAAASGPSGPSARLDDDDATRRQIEQKLQLVARMIGDTASVQRIQASGNALAQTNFEEARVHHAAAVDFLGRSDLVAARRAADDALRHIGLARRLAPDAPGKLAAARQRHDQVLASLDRLMAAWRSRAQVAPPQAQDAEHHTAALGLMTQAAHLAGEKRYDEATALLAQAERHVLEGMNSLMHAATLDYSARPANTAEELEQELARERGLAELVPLALADLKPRPEAVVLIERYAETAATLRAQALLQQQAGDHAAALVLVKNATLYVQRALQTAGLAVPQATGETR